MTHVDLQDKTVAGLSIIKALRPDLDLRSRDAIVQHLLKDYAERHQILAINHLLEKAVESEI